MSRVDFEIWMPSLKDYYKASIIVVISGNKEIFHILIDTQLYACVLHRNTLFIRLVRLRYGVITQVAD